MVKVQQRNTGAMTLWLAMSSTQLQDAKQNSYPYLERDVRIAAHIALILDSVEAVIILPKNTGVIILL